jgi:hypothetical protein
MKIWRGYIVTFAALVMVTVAVYWQGEKCDAEANRCISNFNTPGEANQSNPQNGAVQTCRDSESYFCRVLGPANLPNVYLVLIGFGGIIAAFRTLKILKLQTQTTQDSVQNSIDSERAWIEIALAPAIYRHDTDGDEDPYSAYSVQIKNHGKTIGQIEGFQFGSDTTAGKFAMELMSPMKKTFNGLLGSGEARHLTELNFSELCREWDNVLSSDKKGIIRIAIEYRDVIKNSELHRTAVAYAWNPIMEEPERLPEYDIYD